ncbi:hypothetical protein TNCV_1341951 [Trichonephila clavipes]|uniref:Uncharacterized protein n=1 Tax=Trichonephila clavipes TaxID=2585209 RepID=A0A8X6V0N9_TRICX|nr:hypothetical protein TNCV_1341951 [Trichonephila clavipes]
MACERKLLESEATTGILVMLGEQGNKAVLDWVMIEGLIPSRYESPKCKKDMRLVERKGTIDCFEWRCRVQSKENPPFACRSFKHMSRTRQGEPPLAQPASEKFNLIELIPMYDGSESLGIRRFLGKINDVAELGGWSNGEKVTILKLKLAGIAEEFFFI